MSFQFTPLSRAPERKRSSGIAALLQWWPVAPKARPIKPVLPDAADVFISYSDKNRAKAARLARQLRARGYTVWWAADLLPLGAFRSEIDARLNAASAVIVIWSPESAVSDWVLSEADHAHFQRKLVNTHTPEVKKPAREIPKPFGVRHSARIGDIASILAALAALDVPRLS